MMGQKHLHQLLNEDQEPFLLNKYISDRRSQMIKRPSPPKTSLQQVKKRKLPMNHQIPKSSNFPINLCTKNSCLFSFTETPDFKKSPLFELPSPVKSPCKSPNKIFLHVPSRTASLLLDAALRIQKTKTTKAKTKSKGFGLFGNLFKKLTQRKREIEKGNVSVKDILKMHSQKDNDNMGFHCSYEERLSSGAVWSESNNMETSSSGYYCDSEKIIRFVNNHEECACCHRRGFSESPFRFVLETNPCSGSHTPELASPSCHVEEEKESNEGESVKEIKSGEELEEEEKEQNSPVCVLEPPFEDDEEHVNDDDDDDDEDEGDVFDLESSYAIVQRARQQILYKLCRFEKLLELDPVELEKRMMEQEEEEDDDVEDEDSELSCKENDFKEHVYEAVFLSMVQDKQKIPQQFRKLISDLIVEEGIELESLEDKEMVIRGICKRLESWKEVESNTIDMMIKEDLSREDIVWKKNGEEKSKMAGELEIAIFGFLVEEVSEELVC